MSDALLNKVLSCPNLPSLPAVALQVIELTRDSNVQLKQLAEVLQNDAALATKILKTVNSSFYALREPCPTISRALSYLGLNTVKSLALGFSLVDTFQSTEKEDGFDFIAYWRRGIYGGTAARLIASTTGTCDPEEAFIAALLQDVGMLAMHTALGEAYIDLLDQAHHDHDAVPAIELESLGFDHPEAGAQLASQWHLPESLVQPMRYHHQPDRAGSGYLNISRVVALGKDSAAALTLPDPKEKIAQLMREGNEWFGLVPEDTQRLLAEITDGARELSRLFQLETGDPPDVSSILVQAGEQLVQHQINLDRETRSLREATEDLTRQSLTDGLTQVANRKRFDSEMSRRFEEAQGNGGSLAVLFGDVDRFKLVNDTHGHQAGDAVLVELASRLTEAVGDAGVVCRYGGEEFAVILPGAGRASAATIAEACRQAVEERPFDTSDVDGAPDTLAVTISLGVAAMEPACAGFFENPEAIVQAADRGVYAAKEAGRNCVRVFRAPPSKPLPDETSLAKPKTAPAAAEPGTTPDETTAPQVEAASLHVLLVEDDPLQVKLVETALASMDCIEVVVAEDGGRAIELLKSSHGTGRQPDLVLCDLRMPEVSGLEVVRFIKGNERLWCTPIVMLSISEEDDDISDCLRAGANAYISKAQLVPDPKGKIIEIARFWMSTCRAA
ncbi:MAG: HDOD domain-containing protein [Phycisphaerales bacterium]|nr:HDOD domain-containing protein [Phycisphaerales bacterium]